MSINPKPAAPATPAKSLSDRSFGLIFAAIFAVIALFPLAFGGELRIWAAAIATAFAALALVIPVILAPFNRAWAKFGLFMHKIINPLLMGLIFFLTVLPTGLIMRLLGKDPMHRKLDADAGSYWIDRKEVVAKEFFDDQF